MFPHIPRPRIVEDLRRTGSPNLTSENILNGELDNRDSDSSAENELDRSVNDVQLRQRIIN